MYDKVEKMMQKKGVKVADVAKATGISSSVFTDWKKGRYTPKADKVYALAQYFGVPMEYFFEDDERLDYYYEKIQDQLSEYLNGKSKPLYRASAGQGDGVQGLRQTGPHLCGGRGVMVFGSER